MRSPTLGAIALENFRSEEETKLLDSIDNLRSQGLAQHISLPSLIVCGNQSSGKSSVLEAISSVPFPSNVKTCTRFPTEVILRRAQAPRIEVSISPSPRTKRSADETAKIEGFKRFLTSFDDFPGVIQDAKDAMGIESGSMKFSNDVLRVKIYGPGRPLLTLVDLPGLFSTEEKSLGGESKGDVKRMAEEYMRDQRSIILAVISANEDLVMENVISMIREIDPQGSRTLGIITKPDMLPKGSEMEHDYFEMAHNRYSIKLELGYHALRNRDFATRNDSTEKRDQTEALFFSEGIWADANKNFVGITTLRPRLSEVLLEKIKNELPKIMDELIEKIAKCKSEIEKLGDSRESLGAQSRYLSKASSAFHAIVKTAVKGDSYSGPFFRDSMSGPGYNKRLRAVIEKAKKEFADAMIQRGHLYQIVDDNIQPRNSNNDDRSIQKKEFLRHVAELLERYRGRELPGMFNPLVVGDLFAEQASPWEDIIAEHTKRAHKATTTFLKLAVNEVLPIGVSKPLWELVFTPFLRQRDNELKEKSGELLEENHNLHPITLNDAFTQAIQTKRAARYRHIVMEACGFQAMDPAFDLSKQYPVEPEQLFDTLVKALVEHHTSDMDTFACSEVLDYMEAYYEIALKRIIDNVALQVIEQQLLRKLCNVFTSDSIHEMPPELIKKIAAESAQMRSHRNDLTRKLRLLEEALEAFSPYEGRTPLEQNLSNRDEHAGYDELQKNKSRIDKTEKNSYQNGEKTGDETVL